MKQKLFGKLTAFLLAFAIAACMIPATAFAANPGDPVKAVVQKNDYVITVSATVNGVISETIKVSATSNPLADILPVDNVVKGTNSMVVYNVSTGEIAITTTADAKEGDVIATLTFMNHDTVNITGTGSLAGPYDPFDVGTWYTVGGVDGYADFTFINAYDKPAVSKLTDKAITLAKIGKTEPVLITTGSKKGQYKDVFTAEKNLEYVIFEDDRNAATPTIPKNFVELKALTKWQSSASFTKTYNGKPLLPDTQYAIFIKKKGDSAKGAAIITVRTLKTAAAPPKPTFVQPNKAAPNYSLTDKTITVNVLHESAPDIKKAPNDKFLVEYLLIKQSEISEAAKRTWTPYNADGTDVLDVEPGTKYSLLARYKDIGDKDFQIFAKTSALTFTTPDTTKKVKTVGIDTGEMWIKANAGWVEGTTLTVQDLGLKATYKWYRIEGTKPTQIAKATAKDYILTTDDTGANVTAISVVVTISGYQPKTLTLERSGIISNSEPKLEGHVYIIGTSGSAQVGGTFMAVFLAYVGKPQPDLKVQNITWYRDNVKIDGATGREYKTVDADAGKAITAKVEVAGYDTYGVDSDIKWVS